MNNLKKRILTSIIIFPLSIFFILKGGNYIVSFLYAILILGNYEVFSGFKRKLTIILIDVILVISLQIWLPTTKPSADFNLLIVCFMSWKNISVFMLWKNSGIKLIIKQVNLTDQVIGVLLKIWKKSIIFLWKIFFTC